MTLLKLLEAEHGFSNATFLESAMIRPFVLVLVVVALFLLLLVNEDAALWWTDCGSSRLSSSS
jgi:hypothetical protein